MVSTKKLETVEIEATTKEELKIEIKKYIALGYTFNGDIGFEQKDEFPFYAYVEKNEFLSKEALERK